ncbi:glycosyltransferase family 4 protein [Micromonospora sp. NPDC000089]|uniref:glycosyltransferase family 4 protein n=1 Tax=unclassified Micromonospora TaxID=2617518 RepID=UPI0036B88C9D
MAVPPPDYGGIERVVATLGGAQLRMGNEVTTFSVGTGSPEGSLAWFYPDVTGGWDWADEFIQAARALGMSGDFDVVHNHTALGAAVMHLSRAPGITTLHNFANQSGRLDKIPRLNPDANYVAISENQRRLAGNLNILRVIHNAIPDESFAAPPRLGAPGDHLLFVGRVCDNKGTHLAIDVARRAELPLVIAGPVHETDTDYFAELVEPYVDGRNVQYVGPVAGATKAELYGRALGVVMPIGWEEPFGLVAVEAQAQGTPVLAFRRGALPEIVVPDVTGYLSDSVAEMATQVPLLSTIDRESCANAARSRFSPDRMALDYLDLYKTLI